MRGRNIGRFGVWKMRLFQNASIFTMKYESAAAKGNRGIWGKIMKVLRKGDKTKRFFKRKKGKCPMNV